MQTTLHIFESEKNILGLYDSFYGGLFLLKGVAISLQVGWILLISISFFFAYLSSQNHSKKFNLLSHFFAALSVVVIGFIFFQPWDELFVNLRHSVNWIEKGTFSFNQNQILEGTVDFLPYFIIGVLGKLSLPLIESAHWMSILGSLLCLWAGKKFLVQWKAKDMDIWAYPLFSLFPLIWFNSGHGFSTTCFSACILWSSYFLIYSSKKNIGLILLSLIPLIRIEGIWFVLLFTFFYLNQNKKLIFGFIPFIFLEIWRKYYFGSYIPLPVQYKNTPGNLFFLGVGIRNFFTDLISTFSLFFLFIFCITYFSNSNLKKQLNTTIKLFLALFLFILPYYTSGGDWFPNAWGRYLFPFAFFTLLLAIASANFPKEKNFYWILGILFLIQAKTPYGPLERIEHYLFSGRRILGDIRLDKIRKKRPMNYRIHYLSQMGTHLRETTPIDSTIATSEIATISYFAKRETLDLLGIVNPEIVNQPLRAHPDFFQSPRLETELPHLIFKRVNPDLIGKYVPDYLYAFDLLIEYTVEETPFDELTDKDFLIAYQRWKKGYQNLIQGVFGGIENLNRLGYEPVLVKYHNYFAGLYFVSKKAKEKHLALLQKQGTVRTLISTN